MSRRVENADAFIVTVNYRGATDTLKFLESLRHLKGFPGVDVTVVDNSSGEDSPSKIRAEISNLGNVRLLESGKNRGYFGAAKWAVQEYLDAGKSLPNWIIVCNNDILIEDQDFLVKLF